MALASLEAELISQKFMEEEEEVEEEAGGELVRAACAMGLWLTVDTDGWGAFSFADCGPIQG